MNEFKLTILPGMVYGATSSLVGHPFDTIKTKMQAQDTFDSKSTSMLDCIKRVHSESGLKGFYRGFWFPAFGSVLFRMSSMSTYEAAFTKLGTYEEMKEDLGLGIQL